MPNKLYGPLDPRGWGNGAVAGPPSPARGIASVLRNSLNAYDRAKGIYDEEEARSFREAPGRPQDNIYDAERHARTAYRLSNEFGPNLTRLAGIAKEVVSMYPEIYRPDPSRESLDRGVRAFSMDVHNNDIGVRAADAKQTIPNRQTPGLRTIR